MFEESREKKLLIIGGEANIVNIVNEAKKMGVYTIVTERGGTNARLPAKLVADEAWDIDYSDMEALVIKCREAGVNGVMSGYSEGKVLCAATLSQLLGTPFYATPEQIEITRNKRVFKTLCQQHGVPIPQEYCASGVMNDVEKDAVVFPVIVKPADYGGRIGITVCYDRETLDRAVEEARNCSVSGTVVVEEYVSGIELTAIYTIADGEISLSIINDKHLSKEGVEYACLCDVAITPSEFYGRYVETVDVQIRELIRGIGVRDGIAGFQFIANEEKIIAFEMGLRLNGGNDWKLLSVCNGINHMQMLINHSLTGSMGDSLSKDNPELKEHMATYVMYAHGGEVGEVDYSGVKLDERIIDISPYVYVGKVIPDKGTTQQRVISFKIRANSVDEVAQTIRFIQRNVMIRNVQGEDMLFTPFDTARMMGR